MATKPDPRSAALASATDGADERDATIRELEESNASLAQPVGALQSDVEARDALAHREQVIAQNATTLAEATAHAEQLAGDVDAARERARRLERELEGSTREVEGLHDELRRRSSGAPVALDIAALLELHRIVGTDSDRYLATARRLGDALVAHHSDAAPG